MQPTGYVTWLCEESCPRISFFSGDLQRRQKNVVRRLIYLGLRDGRNTEIGVALEARERESSPDG